MPKNVTLSGLLILFSPKSNFQPRVIWIFGIYLDQNAAQQGLFSLVYRLHFEKKSFKNEHSKSFMYLPVLMSQTRLFNSNGKL